MKRRNISAKYVIAIPLKVGASTSVVPECVEFYLEFLSKGTIAEGAKLEATIVSLTAQFRQGAGGGKG